MCAICWKCFFNVLFSVVLWVCCELCSFSIDFWIPLTVLSWNNTQHALWGMAVSILFSFGSAPFDLLNYAKNVSIPVWNGLFIVTQNVCMKFAKETCRIYIPMSLSNKPLSLLCSHQDTFIRKLSIRRTLNESVSSKQKDRPHRMAWGRYWNMAQTKIVDKTFHFDFQL